MNRVLSLCLLSGFISFNTLGATPNWSEDFSFKKGEHRANIYSLNKSDFNRLNRRGLIHASEYPVESSALFIPYRSFSHLFKMDSSDPLKKIISKVLKVKFGADDIEGFYNWLGLYPYVEEEQQGVFKIPRSEDSRRLQLPLGAKVQDLSGADGLTFGCVSCHSQQLFGKNIIGLTNKRSRSNQLFHQAKKVMPMITAKAFKLTTGATAEEMKIFKKIKENIPSVGNKAPEVLGLTTPLAQVELSLARRKNNPYASKSKLFEKLPRRTYLNRHISDSKPSVWWNVKYKTRWLSDGSIISGNPVLTNILWNEIGRGSDLKELKKWMKINEQKIKELTLSVFANKAPHWIDFFGVQKLNLDKAKRGEKIFNQSCKKCHGEYIKNWSLSGVDFDEPNKFKTAKVIYHEKTPVKFVGTDEGRFLGTKYIANKLNQLEISKWMKTRIVSQRGYVPPPLVGIWMRYPYLHNNSIPNLCALMTPPARRPVIFYQGPSVNPEVDFTFDCIGYPVGDDIPESWKEEKEARFDTRKTGLSNKGHYKMFLNEQGDELYSPTQKRDLLEYLKTL